MDLAIEDEAIAEAAVAEDKRTQSERAFHALRRRILSGALPAGEKLKIETLQREFSLSSTPLREALHRLSVEGLVVSEENRGFRAAPLSAKDLRDITRLRVLVEVDALQDAIQCGDLEWESRIVAAHYRFEKCDGRIADGDEPPDEDWTRLHKAFHMALISGCSYPRLTAMCSSLFDQSERYRRLSARVRSVPRDADDEHRKLMDAVLRRKSDMAKLLLVEHIEETTKHVMAVLVATPAQAPRPARGAAQT